MGTQLVSLALPAPLELGAGAKAAQAWLPLVSPHTLHWHVGLLRQGCAPRALQWVLWLKRMGAVEQLSSSGRAAPRDGQLLALGVLSTGACGTGSGLPAAWGRSVAAGIPEAWELQLALLTPSCQQS